LFEMLLISRLVKDWDSSTMPVESESLASFPSMVFPLEFFSDTPPLLPLSSLPRMTLSSARYSSTA
jgi:hypothetical protein